MSDKTRRILQIFFACVAVVSAVAVIVLLKHGKSPEKTDETTAGSAPIVSTTAAPDVITEIPEETGNPTEDTSAVTTVHKPTEPTTNPNKNYAIFIDKKTFNFTEEKGVTTLVAKGNDKVIMTVTPLLGKDYTEHCAELLEAYASMGDTENLNIEQINSGYRSQTGDKDDDIITTVYCVDDEKGGCVEIKYRTPVSAQSYEKNFKILLSMFKIV